MPVPLLPLAESSERYGASGVTGLVAGVVYGPPHGDCAGKHRASAPTTENTWFQAPWLQPSSWLLLTRPCRDNQRPRYFSALTPVWRPDTVANAKSTLISGIIFDAGSGQLSGVTPGRERLPR